MNGDERMQGNGDDYLWDRSGAPDPDIAALEQLLRGQAHAGAPRLRRSRHVVRRTRRGWRIALAAAAVMALCAIGVLDWYQQRLQWDLGKPWHVVVQQGHARIDGRPVDAGGALPANGLLETGTATVTRLRAAGIGDVVIGEGSRLRLVETRTGRHRVQLQQGSLWARVWAPPGQFGIGVQGAEVLDIGCEFLLQVDAEGNGRLTVRSGWVIVDNWRREVLVPQGTTLRLRGAGSAGSPYDLGASVGFVAALDAIDAREGRVDPRGGEVLALLAAARPQDAISLLSLLQAYPELGDGPMFERMQRLMPDVPASRGAWSSDHDAQLDAWRHALPYPRIKRWWMQWPDVLPTRDRKAEAWLESAGG